jgi:hypothetical protein
MASQVVSRASGGAAGPYPSIWNPVLGQTLLVKREPTNSKDRNAVGLFLEDVVVGHVPHNLARRFSKFLRRDVNKAFAEVTGQKINCGAGYTQTVRS